MGKIDFVENARELLSNGLLDEALEELMLKINFMLEKLLWVDDGYREAIPSVRFSKKLTFLANKFGEDKVILFEEINDLLANNESEDFVLEDYVSKKDVDSLFWLTEELIKLEK